MELDCVRICLVVTFIHSSIAKKVFLKEDIFLAVMHESGHFLLPTAP